ncbi:sel1 repeat family protein [Pseudooceanicola marinus]|nr:sel1 repeat family protein [Pseudooceanicola marinus]
MLFPKPRLSRLSTQTLLGAGLLAGLSGLPAARAQTPPSPEMALLSLATEASAPEAEGIGFYPLATLPDADAVSTLITATMLQSRAVSTIGAAGPGDSGLTAASAPKQLVLETAFELTGGQDQPLGLRQGGQDLSPQDFGPGIAALASGFGPGDQAAAVAVMSDPQDLFPGQIGPLREMLGVSDFGLWVLLIAPGPEAEARSACAAPLARAVTLSLLAGVADRPAFGDGDGATSFAEAETFVTRSLTRALARDTGCPGAYAVVFDHGGEAAAPVLQHDSPVYIPALQADLTLEEFEAEFLAAGTDPAPIRAYLDSCRFCPTAPQLEARLTEIDRRAAQAAIEDQIWTRITSAPENAARLQVYLDRCELCAHRTEAEETLARLAAKAEAAEAESRLYAKLAASFDLEGLRDYVESCVTCEHVEAARARIAEIEADAAYDAEAEALEQAIRARDTDAIRAWIEDCAYCDRRPQAEAALDDLARRAELAGPCLRAAAVSQLGGPRLLSDIDQAAARAACDAALAAFPNDPAFLTISGRIAQAAGDTAAARQAYEAGIAAGVPMAHGLAGYMLFDPAEGDGAPDYDRAEELGLAGAALGDWLSQQLLVLLYSQNFIDGKGADDAFAVAETVAAEGDPVSQYFLGFFFLRGDGPSGRPDPEAAREWLKHSVDAGYVPAMTLLAETLETAVAQEPEAATEAAALYLDALYEDDRLALEKLTTQLRERNRAVVRAVQSRLQEAGVYRGALDGLPGPGTINAVEAYAALPDN